jgi:hypothetical protein
MQLFRAPVMWKECFNKVNSGSHDTFPGPLQKIE